MKALENYIALLKSLVLQKEHLQDAMTEEGFFDTLQSICNDLDKINQSCSPPVDSSDSINDFINRRWGQMETSVSVKNINLDAVHEADRMAIENAQIAAKLASVEQKLDEEIHNWNDLQKICERLREENARLKKRIGELSHNP